MERIAAFWRSGLVGKIVLSIAGLFIVLIVCCIGIVLLPTPARTTVAAPTAAVAAGSVDVPSPVLPTDAPSATPTIAPTDVPIPTPEPSARYLAVARDGAIPVVRPGLPAGEWKALLLDLDSVSITFPLIVGTSNEQIVRLGKTQAQGIIKRLFDAVPELNSVNTIGTLPDGANNTELAAISIVVKRADLQAWDGTSDTIGTWNVSPRLK